MLVVFRIIFMVMSVLFVMFVCILVFMVVFGSLHPLNGFFRFYGIPHHLHQIDDLHILVGGIFQSPLDPAVRLAAHMDKQVAGGNFYDIIGGGLIAVQVNVVIQ